MSILLNYTPGKSQGSETWIPCILKRQYQLYPWQKPGVSCNKMNMINEKQPPDQCDQEVVFFPAFCLSLSGNYGIIEIETKANTNSKYKEELS